MSTSASFLWEGHNLGELFMFTAPEVPDIEHLKSGLITVMSGNERVKVSIGNKLIKHVDPKSGVVTFTVEVPEIVFPEKMIKLLNQLQKTDSRQNKMQAIRTTDLNAQKRIETGALQINDDWPGLFIRGDNAAYYSFQLREILSAANKGDTQQVMELLTHPLNGIGGLCNLLESSRV